MSDYRKGDTQWDGPDNAVVRKSSPPMERLGNLWTILTLTVAFMPVPVVGQAQTRAGQTGSGQAKAVPAPTTTPPPLAIRPPTGTSHDDWIKSWQARIPITASLFRGEHRGQVQGSFYSRNDVDYPVFTATVRIQNRSGYLLTTGSDLYLIQNGTERDGSQLLEVIGGDFREPPLQDYAGEVELRGSEISPDMRVGLIDSIDPKSRRGFFGGTLDVLLSVGTGGGNILDRRLAEARNFGSAASGRDLTFETNDLQLTVHVRKQYEDGVYVISPPVEFRSARESVAFRYVLRFDKTGGKPTEVTLLPMDDTSVLALLKDDTQPLWKRVLAAGWTRHLGSPESVVTLGALAKNTNQPPIVREAALYSLGSRRASFEFGEILANPRESRRIRLAAAWSFGKSMESSAPSILSGQLAKESDQDVGEQLIESLVALKSKDSLDALLKLAQKSGDKLQRRALSAVGELGDESTIGILAQISDKESTLRRFVISSLEKIGSVAAVPILVKMYEANPGTNAEAWTVRMDACSALGKIKSPDSLALLQKAVSDPHSSVSSTATRAIVALGTPESYRVAIGLMDHSSDDISGTAMRALGDAKNEPAKVKLIEVLRNTSASTKRKWTAVDALGNFRGTDVEGALVAALRQEKDANLRADAIDSLALQNSGASRLIVNQAQRDPDSYVAGRAARAWRRINGMDGCTASLGALMETTDGDHADGYVKVLTLPGCRDRADVDKVIGRLSLGSKEYHAKIGQLLKSWTSQDFGENIEKWQEWRRGLASR